MDLNGYIQEMRPAIEDELQWHVDSVISEEINTLGIMISYHMGWEGDGAGRETQGKRIRPLLVLLSAVAAGTDWHQALPAAAAVEFVHNFSLVHDDIQDQSPLRRGRPTLWKKWGVAKAINAGDLIFTMANIALLQFQKAYPTEIASKSAEILYQACVRLTEGQHLDLTYESMQQVSLDKYWLMIERKTAALLACSTELGALSSNVSEIQRRYFKKFGFSLGLTFQVVDDWLGIWGDLALLGKSTDSDLVSGKKTLPILYALEKRKRFAKRWLSGPISPSEVPMLAKLLIEDGAQAYTEAEASRLTTEAIQALESVSNKNDAINAIEEMANSLLLRQN